MRNLGSDQLAPGLYRARLRRRGAWHALCVSIDAATGKRVFFLGAERLRDDLAKLDARFIAARLCEEGTYRALLARYMNADPMSPEGDPWRDADNLRDPMPF